LQLQQERIKANAAKTERLNQMGLITIKFDIDEQQHKTFNDNEKIVLYRIFQESISNSLKHADADVISVSLKTAHQVEMEVRDNGKGFDFGEATTKNNSLGLLNIEQRAAIIGYTVKVVSAPGKGTAITVSEKQ